MTRRSSRTSSRRCSAKKGYDVLSARTGEEGLEVLAENDIDLVLLDLMLPGMSGQEVLQQIRRRDPETVVVVVTAYSSIEGAIAAMRARAPSTTSRSRSRTKRSC